MSQFFALIPCGIDENYSVLIEDDGRVAYAYLLEYGNTIGDVWLYNRDQAPLDTNWALQSAPYLNPAEFLSAEAKVSPVKNENEIYCEWSISPAEGIMEVGIYIRGKFIASIESGSKPGWSVLVIKDGPLALVY